MTNREDDWDLWRLMQTEQQIRKLAEQATKDRKEKTDLEAKQRAEARAKWDEGMKQLRARLGLRPDQTLADFVGLSPSREYSAEELSELLDPKVVEAIDEFIDKTARILAGETGWEGQFPKPRRRD